MKIPVAPVPWQLARRRYALCLAIVLLALNATAARGNRYLDLSVGGVRADETFKARGDINADLEFEAVTVWRLAIDGGVKHGSGFEVGPELAWSQRGGYGDLLAVSIPQRVLTRYEFERTYLDASISVRRSCRFGSMSISIGGSPRASRLRKETPRFFFRGEPQKWVFGVDPEVRVAYSSGYVWVRYYWDLSPSYEVARSEMRDRSLYVGLGMRTTFLSGR